jgi:putative membrane protein
MPSEAAVGPRRTSPLTVVLGAGGLGFSVALLFVVRESPFFILLAALSGFRMIGWWYLTYETRDDELVIRSGVLQRRLQVVPYARVQQIDFHRNLTAQIFGLTEMRIDTAGSASGRVQLAYLDLATAERLRSHILAKRSVPATVAAALPSTDHDALGPRIPDPPAPARRLATFDLGALARSGATSDWCALTILVAPVAVVTIVLFAIADGDGLAAYGGSLVFAIVAPCIVVAVAITRSCLTYYGLTLDLVGDDLVIDYGLFERQHLTMPRSRVQHVALRDNPLRRRFGLATVSIRSAARPGAQNATHLVLAGVDSAVAATILDLAIPGIDRDAAATLQSRPPAARRRAIIRRVALLSLPGVLATATLPPFGLVVFAVAPVGVVWGRRAHLAAGHRMTAETILVASGPIVRTRDFVVRARTQSVRAVSSPFQRRVGLATLRLDLAGGEPWLYDIDVVDARAVAGTIVVDQTLARSPEGS